LSIEQLENSWVAEDELKLMSFCWQGLIQAEVQ
jgi:hypothetical protein